MDMRFARVSFVLVVSCPYGLATQYHGPEVALGLERILFKASSLEGDGQDSDSRSR